MTGGARDVRALGALATVSAALLGVRLYAASVVGFGDSEALYASYALHPQAAYLDHPGLIGVVASLLGGGTAPTPTQAHLFTSLVATLMPWALALACRACGAPWPGAFAGATVFALVPEMAIGLFALTPDVLLAASWIATLGLAAVGLRAPVGHVRGTAAFYGAGLCAGIACASKTTGVLLFVALAATYASRASRAHGRSLAPWLGLLAGALVVAPVGLFEWHAGWSLLRHRLIDTQDGAGFSFRNAAALVGGQLLYVSPVTAVIAGGCSVALWREWRARPTAVTTLLFATSALPAAVLVPLCLWSRVAEPHWLAPALLALVPAATCAAEPPSARMTQIAAGVGAVGIVAVHAWVLVPGAANLAPETYDPRLDLSNELYGWPTVVGAVRHEVVKATTPGSGLSEIEGDVVVVAPHWVLCAQLDAALRGDVGVGCDTPIEDDYDRWYPRQVWRRADTLIWVTDTRFGPPNPPAPYALVRSIEIPIFRDRRIVRTFTLTVLTRRGLS